MVEKIIMDHYNGFGGDGNEDFSLLNTVIDSSLVS